MARYRTIHVRVWGDEKFRELSQDGRLLWLYLLTNPETTTVPGLFRAGKAAIAEALGWLGERFPERFDERFAELSSRGMAKADWTARVVWVPNVVLYNPPANPNVVKSWIPHIDEVPECSLKCEALQALREHVSERGERFAEPFIERFPERFPEPSRNGMRNQDQDQDLDQEQAPLAPQGGESVTPAWMAEAWNATCAAAGMREVRLPLSQARSKRFQRALNAAGADRDAWQAAIEACALDPHWRGGNGWKGNLDSFLELKHRERWLDAGAVPDEDPDAADIARELDARRAEAEGRAPHERDPGSTSDPIAELRERAQAATNGITRNGDPA